MTPSWQFDSDEIRQLPRWATPWLWILTGSSLLGLCVSIFVHIRTFFTDAPAPNELFWGLHSGIFAILLPALWITKTRFGFTHGRDSWKLLLSGLPDWIRFALYGFFGYAILNFVLFILQAPPKGYATPPPMIVWRGFSGHWMFFYACGAVLLYKSAYSAQHKGLLPNGETFLQSDLCPRCGLPANQCHCFTLSDETRIP